MLCLLSRENECAVLFLNDSFSYSNASIVQPQHHEKRAKKQKLPNELLKGETY